MENVYMSKESNIKCLLFDFFLILDLHRNSCSTLINTKKL